VYLIKLHKTLIQAFLLYGSESQAFSEVLRIVGGYKKNSAENL
jgi:hypothetical protein